MKISRYREFLRTSRTWHAMSLLVCGLCTMLFMAACSDDTVGEVEVPGQQELPEAETPFYISLNVVVPGSEDGTRSSTNSDGGTGDIVNPSANESLLKTARLYFCTKTGDQYTVVAQCQTSENSGPFNQPNYQFLPSYKENSTHRLEIEVELDQLKKIIGKTVYIFMVGNYDKLGKYDGLQGWNAATAKDIDKNPANAKFNHLDGGWAALTNYVSDYDASETERGKGQVLPFTNASEFSIRFGNEVEEGASDAELIEAIKSVFTQKATNGYGHVYDVPNVLQLERAVARVDFNPTAKPDFTDQNTDYSYSIINSNFYVRLDRMIMLNMNSNAFLFRHTLKGTPSDAYGLENETVKLFGVENDDDSKIGTTYNWIVGADWGPDGKKGRHDLSNLVEWEYIDKEAGIKQLVPDDSKFDYDAGIKMTDLEKHPFYDSEYYRPWAYIYENTIPTGYMMSDDEIIKYATGVMFKFVLLAEPDKSNNNKRPDLTWEMIGGDQCPANIAFSTEEGASEKTITITNNDAKWTDVALVNGHYELTYIGWIVHNEVGSEEITTPKAMTVPGPMAYGIVRNNVYQLSINSIQDIPNPREPRTFILQLDCEVLPWNVRWDDNVTLY